MALTMPVLPVNTTVLARISVLLSATATEVLLLLDDPSVKRDNGRVTAAIDHLRSAQNCIRDALLLDEIDALTPSEDLPSTSL